MRLHADELWCMRTHDTAHRSLLTTSRVGRELEFLDDDDAHVRSADIQHV